MEKGVNFQFSLLLEPHFLQKLLDLQNREGQGKRGEGGQGMSHVRLFDASFSAPMLLLKIGATQKILDFPGKLYK